MKTVILILSLVLTGSGLFPESQVSLSTSDSLATIGDRITLKIIVKTSPEIEKIALKIPDKNFESISKRQFPGRKTSEYSVFEIHEVISFFSIGNHTVGPFTVQMISDNRIVEEKQTNSLDIKITSVLEKSDQDIKDLKNLISMRGNPFYVLKYVFVLLGLALLIILVILYIRKKKRQEQSKPQRILSPLEELEEAIDKLHKKNWLKKKRFKVFFITLTDIFKNYLHREFGFNAEDLTTEETMWFVERKEPDTGIRKSLEYLFRQSDLVKFAKFQPGSSDLDTVEGEIESIINKKRALVSPDSEDQNVSAGE
jgi:hypothetical protein